MSAIIIYHLGGCSLIMDSIDNTVEWEKGCLSCKGEDTNSAGFLLHPETMDTQDLTRLLIKVNQ